MQSIVMNATGGQIETIYNNHLKLPVTSLEYTEDDEDNIGFVKCYSVLGNKISFQLRGDTPCFIEFYAGDNHRYDIHEPDGIVFKRLQEIGIRARDAWDKGSQIPTLKDKAIDLGKKAIPLIKDSKVIQTAMDIAGFNFWKPAFWVLFVVAFIEFCFIVKLLV